MFPAGIRHGADQVMGAGILLRWTRDSCSTVSNSGGRALSTGQRPCPAMPITYFCPSIWPPAFRNMPLFGAGHGRKRSGVASSLFSRPITTGLDKETKMSFCTYCVWKHPGATPVSAAHRTPAAQGSPGFSAPRVCALWPQAKPALCGSGRCPGRACRD